MMAGDLPPKPSAESMPLDVVYRLILRRPWLWIVVYVLGLLAVAVVPANWLESATFWRQSPEWGRLVFQFGGLLLALLFGVIPIAKWYDDQRKARLDALKDLEARIRRLIEQKPIVVSDVLEDGRVQMSNVGSSPAIDVWVVLAAQTAPVALGSLDAHSARGLPVVLGERLSEPHILIAAARPYPGPGEWQRPFTVTFNAPTSDGSTRHGFDRDPPTTRLYRGGTIGDYLVEEREALLGRLQAFAADGPLAPSRGTT